MKKGTGAIFVLIAVLVASILFYCRPMTLEQITGVDVAKSISLKEELISYQSGEGTVHQAVVLKGEPGYDEMVELFRTKTFRRSMWNLFAKEGTELHAVENGDEKWQVGFCYEEEYARDGGTVSGELLRVKNYFGKLTVWTDGNITITCKTNDQFAWIDTVSARIAEQTAE